MSKRQFWSVSLLIVFILFLAAATGKLSAQKKAFRLAPTDSVTQHPLYYIDSEISPNGRYRIDSFSGNYSDRYNYYQIFVTNLQANEIKRLYSGDFRTTDWKWTPDNKVKVVYNCGTGCRASKIIGMNEHISLADDEDDGMNEENGWNVEFFRSF